MNIVIASGIFPPDIGGPANFVPRIANWLAERGHQVHVVCWSDHLKHEDDRYPFTLHRILRHRSPVLRFWQTVNCLYQLGQSADILFANTLDLEVRLAATFAKKPAVHKVVGDRAWEIVRRRGWFDGTLDEYQIEKDWRFRALNALRNFSLGRSHILITPSQYLANIVCGWSAQIASQVPTKVIYNSTQLAPEAAPVDLPPYLGKTITTICRLVPWKGVDALIDAVSQLSDIQLLIVGDGPERAALDRQVRQLSLENRVHFLGQVTKSQVCSTLDATDIFVLNSAYEGLPHVVLEAMAARVPVIATNVGGTSEVVKDQETGLLISTHDMASLSAAIDRLLRSPEYGQQLADNAQALIQAQFSEQVCFVAYEKVLSSACARAGKRSTAVRISAAR